MKGEIVVVSPDAGGVERARSFAKRIEAPLAIIDKRRDRPNQATATHVIGDVDAKRIFMMLSRWKDKRVFSMKISELMNELQTPEYAVKDFEKYVLKTAFREMINNLNSVLQFKYSLSYTGTKVGKGKRGFDTVTFKVYDKLSEAQMEEFLTDSWSNRINAI